MHHIQHQHQLTNRRPSDVRNANSQISIGTNTNPNSRPPLKHGDSPSSYNNGSSNINSNNNLTHKSASNLPPTAYPLGRLANSSNNSNNNRTVGMNPPSSSGFPDPSTTGNRDSRILLTAPGPSVVGSMMAQGGNGNGNDCSNPSATLLGNYVDRETNAQAVNSLSRWSLLAGDSCGVGGGAGDSGMQQNGFGSAGGQVVVGGSGNAGVGTVAAGNGSGSANAQRNPALLGDGAQSLPSLKDSGLLDSWGSSRATAAVDTQKQVSNGSSQQQQQQKQQQSLSVLPRATTLGNSINTNLPSTSQHYTMHQHHQDVTELRPPTTLGMPVGMSWLANESR